MPRARKTRSARTTKSSTSTSSPSMDMSYETKMIIVIVLLLFVYPIGLILMWVWMDKWPVWLKIVLSLPVALAVLAIFVGFSIAALILRSAVTNRDFQNNMRQYMQQRYQYEQSLTPAPTNEIFVTPTPAPTDITPTTY